MRAAYINQTGPVESIQVGDLPVPEPGPGQVLVKVGAVSLNPIDLMLRSGMVAMVTSFPYVIGCDLAGTVESLGPGASQYKVGDRVFGSNQGLLGRQGVAAEYAAVDEQWLYPSPANLDDAAAAALALTGITAHLGLFRSGRLAPTELAYVPGGTGGVGSMVIQMARAAGARVATSAGSAEKMALCTESGADLALNYKTDDLPGKLREFAPEGFDVWYETRREPDLEEALALLRRRGRMILIAGRQARPILPVGSLYPRDCSILGFAMFNAPASEQRVAADDIRRWAEAGSLKPRIGRTFPLAEAAAAEAFLEENTMRGAGTLIGKVVIRVA